MDYLDIKYNTKDKPITDYPKKFANYNFVRFNLENKKILGIHFRGTSYKTSRGHIFPATKSQMKKNVDEILSRENFDKIFLCSEEKNYLDFFIKNYKDKLLYLNT